jgi:hypothetical protein
VENIILLKLEGNIRIQISSRQVGWEKRAEAERNV